MTINHIETLVRDVFDKMETYCAGSAKKNVGDYSDQLSANDSFKDKSKIIDFYCSIFRYYEQNGLSKSVVDRLYTVYGTNFGCGYGITPNKIISLGVGQHGSDAKIVGDELPDISIKKLFESLFKGVAKNEPLPEFFRPLQLTTDCETLDYAFNTVKRASINELYQKKRAAMINSNSWDDGDINSAHYSITASQHAAFIEDGDLCPLNTKNLMKYHKYSQQDAKKMYSVLTFLADGVKPVKILKRPKQLPPLQKILSLGLDSDHKYYAWELEHIEEWALYNKEHLSEDENELLLKELDAPLPIKSYSFWLQATKEWYEGSHQDSCEWGLLATQTKHRHIVNMIRHNAVGYCQIWRYASDINRSYYHDKAKATILTKILKEFPVLASACLAQLSSNNGKDDESCQIKKKA
ncbi:hypothetical protein [Photobacterium toruni]|uniref:hypothetical protein n=1 Tax=Photobacterium toruni TaxID=1935446 RepID=UPI00210FCBF1|nr:hypothetical protein [Photobacterium toruni]